MRVVGTDYKKSTHYYHLPKVNGTIGFVVNLPDGSQILFCCLTSTIKTFCSQESFF